MGLKKTITIIDPPGGWRYGFPKAIPNEITDITKWLIENGYPQIEIGQFDGQIPCRFWEEEVESTQ